jgi:hypothetical protein
MLSKIDPFIVDELLDEGLSEDTGLVFGSFIVEIPRGQFLQVAEIVLSSD